MNRTALLIIDVQHGLCTGEWAMADIAAVIERINAASARAREAGMPVVLVQHEEAEGLVWNTPMWRLDDRLVVQPSDLRVRKTAPDSFHATELRSLLDARGVTDLVVCGLQTDYCINATVRSAAALGYPVTVLADAHSTMDADGRTAAQIVAAHNEALVAIEGGATVRAMPAGEWRGAR